MAAQRFRLLRDGEILRSSKRSPPPQLSGPARASRLLQHLDFVGAISFREVTHRCAGPELARAAASVQDLEPARGQKSNGAVDLSPDTSGKSSRGHDLLLDSTGTAAAARLPAVT